MLSSFVLVVWFFGALVSARPPTVFQHDGAPKSLSGKDPLLADLEGLTRNKQDRSGKGSDPLEKYFHESDFDAHYDGRFASNTLPLKQRISHLRALVRSYLSTMHSLEAETWIMHGSLLGWWWNKRIMPWDADIDVQVSESAMEFLASYYNMTVHTYTDTNVTSDEDEQPVEEERKYLLEVNPYYKNSSTDDSLNVIDARWIDTTTGLYIDITVLRVNRTVDTRYTGRLSRYPPPPASLYCKDKHHYLATQIYPLRDTTFEGVPAKVPYAYQELLAEEYGEDSLINTVYKNEHHVFDQDRQKWVPMTIEMVRKLAKEEREAKAALRKAQRKKAEEEARERKKLEGKKGRPKIGFLEAMRLRGPGRGPLDAE